MAKNRYVPFGYRILHGAHVICEPEADCIRLAFREYEDGASLLEIAKILQQSGVVYHEGSDWNKHMVKRMLENERYVGNAEYPAIITLAQFRQVQLIRQSKQVAVQRKEKEILPPSIPVPSTLLPDIRITRMENQLQQELNRPVLEPERIEALILQCAVMKYESCFDRQYME